MNKTVSKAFLEPNCMNSDRMTESHPITVLFAKIVAVALVRAFDTSPSQLHKPASVVCE